MAFDIKNLCAIINNKNNDEGTGTPSIFAFYNKDADTVTTAGFIPAHVGVKANDQVQVFDQDYLGQTWYQATVTGGVITLVVHA